MKQFKKALIFGISGQDGFYLTELLYKKNYEIHGTSRSLTTSSFANLEKTDMFKDIKIYTVDPIDNDIVLKTIKKVNQTKFIIYLVKVQ